MDPKANLDEQVDLSREIIDAIDKEKPDVNLEEHAEQLAELVLALHEWRQKGGFDPYGT